MNNVADGDVMRFFASSFLLETKNRIYNRSLELASMSLTNELASVIKIVAEAQHLHKLNTMCLHVQHKVQQCVKFIAS